MAFLSTLEAASTTYVLDAAGEATDGQTVVIAGKTYTFRATVGALDGSVHIGATVVDTVKNLIAAVNLDPTYGETGTEGTDYGANMTVNPHVYAVSADNETITFRSKVPGAIGNLITLANGTATGTVGNATLENGAGDIDAFFNDLFARNQIHSELVDALRQFSTVEGGAIDATLGTA